jgi:hypothetical protein
MSRTQQLCTQLSQQNKLADVATAFARQNAAFSTATRSVSSASGDRGPSSVSVPPFFTPEAQAQQLVASSFIVPKNVRPGVLSHELEALANAPEYSDGAKKSHELCTWFREVLEAGGTSHAVGELSSSTNSSKKKKKKNAKKQTKNAAVISASSAKANRLISCARPEKVSSHDFTADEILIAWHALDEMKVLGKTETTSLYQMAFGDVSGVDQHQIYSEKKNKENHNDETTVTQKKSSKRYENPRPHLPVNAILPGSNIERQIQSLSVDNLGRLCSVERKDSLAFPRKAMVLNKALLRETMKRKSELLRAGKFCEALAGIGRNSADYSRSRNAAFLVDEGGLVDEDWLEGLEEMSIVGGSSSSSSTSSSTSPEGSSSIVNANISGATTYTDAEGNTIRDFLSKSSSSDGMGSGLSTDKFNARVAHAIARCLLDAVGGLVHTENPIHNANHNGVRHKWTPNSGQRSRYLRNDDMDGDDSTYLDTVRGEFRQLLAAKRHAERAQRYAERNVGTQSSDSAKVAENVNAGSADPDSLNMNEEVNEDISDWRTLMDDSVNAATAADDDAHSESNDATANTGESSATDNPLQESNPLPHGSSFPPAVALTNPRELAYLPQAVAVCGLGDSFNCSMFSMWFRACQQQRCFEFWTVSQIKQVLLSLEKWDIAQVVKKEKKSGGSEDDKGLDSTSSSDRYDRYKDRRRERYSTDSMRHDHSRRYERTRYERKQNEEFERRFAKDNDHEYGGGAGASASSNELAVSYKTRKASEIFWEKMLESLNENWIAKKPACLREENWVRSFGVRDIILEVQIVHLSWMPLRKSNSFIINSHCLNNIQYFNLQ